MKGESQIVVNVQQLYDVARQLYDVDVLSSDVGADSILDDLNMAILTLKNTWKGADAGVRIQEVVYVHNSMVAVRNALAELAKASVAVACDKRETMIANGANVSSLSMLNYDTKTVLPEHSDNTDQIYILPDAEVAKQKIDASILKLDNFTSNIKTKYSDIMDNWQSGPGRDVADKTFTNFINNVNNYKQRLTDASHNITTALQNYGL